MASVAHCGLLGCGFGLCSLFQVVTQAMEQAMNQGKGGAPGGM